MWECSGWNCRITAYLFWQEFLAVGGELMRDTVQRKLLSIILMVMIPLLLLTNAAALYIRREALESIAQEQTKEVEYNAAVLREDLNSMEEFIRFTYLNNTDYNVDSDDVMNRAGLYRYLKHASNMISHIDYAVSVSKRGNIIDARKSETVPAAEQEFLSEHASAYTREHDSTARWNIIRSEKQVYLAYEMMIGSAMYGVYANERELLKRMNTGEDVTYGLITGEQRLTETMQKGKAEGPHLQQEKEAGSGNEESILYIDVPISETVVLRAALDRSVISGRMDRMVLIIQIISVLSVLLLPLFYYQIRKWYVRPVQDMTLALQRFAASDLQYRMNGNEPLKEFSQMQQSFNKMADDLILSGQRIREEEQKRQKAQLSMLQTKIHPHTFLNSLTTISNLAALDEKEKLQQYIDRFSTHMRYMMGNGFHKIRLEEELWFVDNYIGMQNIRADHSIFLYRMADEEALQCRITPFSVYTFVENTIKHGAPEGGYTDIYFDASITDARLRMKIRDNGRGFTEDRLRELNSMTSLSEDDTRHIGIKNMYRILELEYGEAFELRFSNAEAGGAVVEIGLPVQ